MTMQASQLIAIRKQLGMTQAALADALNVNRKTIGRMEEGGEIDRRTELAIRYLEITRQPEDQTISNDSMTYRISSAEDLASWRTQKLAEIEADLERLRAEVREYHKMSGDDA